MTTTTRTPSAEKLLRRMRSSLLMRLFFFAKLPLALVAGLKVREITEERCVTSVPYGWRSTNPFGSTYFAALAMAAELSTGALAALATELAPSSVALLIVGLEASFEKKATGLTTFVCADGARAATAVAETVRTGEPTTARMETVGTSPDGTVVARFTFTWSFRKRMRP